MSRTIQTLKDWRLGSTVAECLTADILSLEGYKSIDPQSPLGGRDGIKDVVCQKDSAKWVCGEFFPSNDQTFASIKEKIELLVKQASTFNYKS